MSVTDIVAPVFSTIVTWRLNQACLCFLPRNRPQVCGPGRCGHPHHLWPPGSHVCPCCAGWLPVNAAAGVRSPTGLEHWSHSPQQQHQGYGLWQAGRDRHPGYPHRPHSVLRPLQPPAFCPLCTILHSGHPLLHQYGVASAHTAHGLPLGKAVPQPMLCKDPPEDS